MTDTRYRLAAVAILTVAIAAVAFAGLFGWWVFLRVLVRMFGPIQ